MTSMRTPSEIRDNLFATFADKPMTSIGQCPLQQVEIAIFPVRYALDEAAHTSGEPGPHPIPATWQGAASLPVLHTRTYTQRQLRDGWLYVIDQTANTLDEYRVQDATFSKQAAAAGGSAEPALGHLLYPRGHQLLLAYSSVKWSEYTHERMADPAEQARWMRPLDLAGYAHTMQAPHCAALTEIAEHVADIDPGTAKADLRFDSTLVATQAQDAEQACKPALGSDRVLACVPDQDSALFIALDDPLGILEDLSMQAAGPALALAQFEEQHMHRLTVAQYVEMLAGADFSDLETTLNVDDQAFHTFKRKAQRYLDARVMQQFDAANGGTVGLQQAIKERDLLIAEYGEDIVDRVDRLLAQWRARDSLRGQVRFGEAQQYVLEKRAELDGHQASLNICLEDLIVWLKRLGTDPLCVFHDQTEESQCLSLIEHADAWLGLLTQHEAGRDWVIKDYAEPNTLMGLAHYNFDKELASNIDRLAQEFTEQEGINLAVAGSVAKRSQEITDVLSNETIRNSALFQRMSQPAQRAYDTLLKVASQHFEDLWEAFEYKLLPAVSSRLGPQWKPVAYLTISVAVQSTVDEIKPYLILDPEYRQKHARWTRQVVMVTRKLNAQSHVARTGARHDRQAATRDVRQLKQQLDSLMLEMPAKILARGEIHQQTQHTAIQQRTFTIETLGRAELAQQLEAKAKDYGSYIKRANDWVKNNINKGLAGLVTVLNFWNVHTAMADAGASGEWTTKDQLSVSTAAATMLSGLTALAIMPAWARMAGLTGEATVKGKAVQVRLVDAAAKYWHPDHGQHKALFKTFAKRAFAMSGLAVIASVAETFQIKEEIDNADSEAEKLALQSKRVLTIGMGGVGTFQVFRSLGVFFGSRAAGLVFAPWIIVAFAIAGAAYLIISLVADSLKLEGLKLWLYRSSWSNSQADYWPDTEEGNKDELRALQEVLLRPTIVAQTLKGKMSDLNNPNRNGVWLKLVLPPDVAGQDIRIYPIMVAEGGWFSRDRQTGYRANLYAEYFAEGNWIGLEQLGDWESLDVRKYRDQLPAQYAPEDWRVWLVHLPHRWGMDRLEVEIHYPPAMLDRPDTLGYRFNIDLNGMKAGSLHENPYVHGQVTEPDGGSRPLVIDSIPAGTRNILTLGVI
ncbi:T6SS effector BTH_I2691 family protein [Halopseudomonas sp. SMJS2]|uniref:T6SS effector BTH_I2691 family protein n=1 Tax=Halopseudomonas sp. SMJS2 TaxID=3041098 RepID=UPI00245332A2|nr:T6SS effector BTH_I2691 family protein [Halopseudomonas sp. SMJS2]WGK62406.1 T6SS effector BTH_I2691 family protein [Halopseudomonas sp. SMJS2]